MLKQQMAIEQEQKREMKGTVAAQKANSLTVDVAEQGHARGRNLGSQFKTMPNSPGTAMKTLTPGGRNAGDASALLQVKGSLLSGSASGARSRASTVVEGGQRNTFQGDNLEVTH